jgi:hypothetical protein
VSEGIADLMISWLFFLVLQFRPEQGYYKGRDSQNWVPNYTVTNLCELTKLQHLFAIRWGWNFKPQAVNTCRRTQASINKSKFHRLSAAARKRSTLTIKISCIFKCFCHKYEVLSLCSRWVIVARCEFTLIFYFKLLSTFLRFYILVFINAVQYG